MSWTKLQLVDQAFEEIGLASYTYDLNPDQYDSGLRRLDAMMASWTLLGISLGYPIPTNPQDSALSEDSNITTNAQAVYTNLAVIIAPIIGKAVSSETKSIASKTYSDLLIAASLPGEMGFPGTLPKGQGQRSYIDSYDPYLTNSEDSGSGVSAAITYFTQLGDLIQGTGQNDYRILKNNIDATTAPGITDDEDSDYNVSSMWIDVTADQAYVCVDNTAGAAVWIETTAGASGGQTNTASNVGTGSSVFKQKNGVDLEFNGIKSENNLLAVALDATSNDIELTVSQTNINSGVSIPASQVTDFDTEVSNNSSVTANSAKVTYPSADSTKVGFISVTQAVDLDAMESNIATNNAKVTNATHSGDVTGDTTLTIADDAVTYAKMQNVVSDNVILGNNSGAGAVVDELTATEVRTLINVADGATANTGTVDTSGTPVANDFAKFTDADTIEGRSYTETKSDLSLNLVENTALSTYLTGLTEDTNPDSDADFIHIYDTSGTADKKVKPQNVCKYSNINAQTGTTYTLALTDAQGVVTLSNAVAIALTVPTNATIAFPIGTTITLFQQGAGQVTISGAGVTLNSEGGALKSNAQYSPIGLIKIAADAWNITGSITT